MLAAIAWALTQPAQTPGVAGTSVPYAPKIEPASDEPNLTMRGFKIPEHFQISCFAAEPRVAHPVCFWIARNGDCFVAETFRHHAGVFDIRDQMDWLDDDLAARSVEDRIAMYRKHLGARFGDYEVEHERVRLLRDTDGDGRVDWDTVFADGFKRAQDGIGAGLLENAGDVYYTCIPDLWRLRDDDHDGRADVRADMATGFGIRVALLGHDMHGLQIGPDGKLYWSIGDRGFRVKNKEGVLLDNPLTGAVLRANLDGSQMEIFATGLRNPQELAFDDFGNLWTGDNNSDGGDEARLVQVIEAGETGWRQAYQWLNDPNVRGPWNDERLWKPHFDGQAAYVVPPVANVAHGPSGLAIDPGTGLSARWKQHFFLCDFEGATEWSGILTFTVEPRGASFTVSTPERFVWGPLATDCDFGLDGGLYVSDWVAGWNKTGKGRIWHVTEPDVAASAIVASTRALLMGGMKSRSCAELATLLAHADRRVRQDAHLELAARGKPGVAELVRVARDDHALLLARLHAVWGLGVAHAHSAAEVVTTLGALLGDGDAEVRAQAARVAGDLRLARGTDTLIALLRDPSARVRMYAAIGLARIGNEKAFAQLLDLVRETGERDAHLRHAAIYGLWSCATADKVALLASDPSVDVRVAAVVCLRHMQSPLIARFLGDAAWRVRAEAARAIYDVPIEGALKDLAALLVQPALPAFDVRVPVSGEEGAFQAGNGLIRRVLCANWRLGTPESAVALAQFAANPTASVTSRVDALECLSQWKVPAPRDRLRGEWAPLEARDDALVGASLRALDTQLPDATPAEVMRVWVRLCAEQNVRAAAPRITRLALDPTRAAPLRAESLAALGHIAPDGVLDTLKLTLFDAEPTVRAASIAAFQRVAPDEALPLLERALEASIAERRAAYQGLAKLSPPRVVELLERELQALDHGERPAAIALDLVTAVEAHESPTLTSLRATRDAARANDSKTAGYLDSLYGGDAAKGRDVFRKKTELECMRCHTAENEGGVVGPNLKDLHVRLTREKILESIVDPNRVFSPGYQGSVVFVTDGTPVEGTLVEDTPDHVTVRKSDAQLVVIARAEIEAIKPGLSAMPVNLAEHLSREEMRDLIEYLSRL